MKLPRRNFLHLAAMAAALPAVSRFAWAQAYPSRPVRIIVGFPPGGPGGIVTRVMGQWLSERLGQPFIVTRPKIEPHITARRAPPAIQTGPPVAHDNTRAASPRDSTGARHLRRSSLPPRRARQQPAARYN